MPCSEIVGSLTDGAHNGGVLNGQDVYTGRILPMVCAIQERASCENIDAGPDGSGVRDDGLAYTLEARHRPQAVAFQQNQLGEVRTSDIAGTLNTNSNASGRNTPLTLARARVRRLTPMECERLMGFPDGYTAIPVGLIRKKIAKDGPRYKAIGNSMAVPCMNWLGKRIEIVEGELNDHKNFY